MRPTMGCDKLWRPRTFELNAGEKLPAGFATTAWEASERSYADNRDRAKRPAIKKAGPAASRSDKGEERKMIEGAWIIVVAVVAFATIVGVVLLVSEKLYDPNRSRQ